MSIGEKIKFYQKQAKLTQKGLAALSSLSRSYIADLERNRYNHSVDTLRTLADALNISTSDLMTVEQEVNSDPNIKILNRVIKEMSPEQRKKAIKILEATFGDLFDSEKSKSCKGEIKKNPNVVVFMEGGIIQDIKSDQLANVVVVDWDTEDVPKEELTTIFNEQAYVYQGIQKASIEPKTVHQVFKEANIESI